MSSVIRLRPAVVAPEGLRPEQLERISRTLTSAPVQRAVTLQFEISADPGDPEFVARLVTEIRLAVAAGPSLLIIDMDFDPTVLRGQMVCDGWLAAALFEVEGEIEGVDVLVLVSNVPTKADQVTEVLELEAFEGRLAFMAARGKPLGGIDGRPLARAQFVLQQAMPDRIVDVVDGTLRRRGVFVHPRGAGESYFSFHYDALSRTHESLASLVAEYIRVNNVRLVVVDASSAGSWFLTCMRAATVDAGVPLREARGGAPEDLPDRVDGFVCFAVPAFGSGATLRTLFNSTRVDAKGAVFLAIYLSEKKAAEASFQEASGLYRHDREDEGGAVRFIDFVAPVPIESVPSSNWKVAAARRMGEIEAVTRETSFSDGEMAPSIRPTNIGMWSLLEQCGAGEEYVHPGSRPPVRYFPDLRRLDDWDSFWLAEALVREATSRLSTVRGAIHFVVPVEKRPNGLAPITIALRDRCDVNLVEVDRDVIEGDRVLPERDRRTLEDSDRHLVVLDESTVTGGTLALLGRLVDAVAGRAPELYMTVVNLGGEPPSGLSPFTTFESWRALERSVAR